MLYKNRVHQHHFEPLIDLNNARKMMENEAILEATTQAEKSVKCDCIEDKRVSKPEDAAILADLRGITTSGCLWAAVRIPVVSLFIIC
jgi:hypothetical protein